MKDSFVYLDRVLIAIHLAAAYMCGVAAYYCPFWALKPVFVGMAAITVYSAYGIWKTRV